MSKPIVSVLALGALVAAFATNTAHAAIGVTSSSFAYTQSFDSLASSGAATAWANDSTLVGWSLYTGAGNTVPTYLPGDGAGNTGSFYSFGAGGSTDRALGGVASGGTYFGSPASGAVAGYIAVAFQNTTGASLDGFNLNFAGEQWRNGGNTSAQAMVLEYGFGNSFAAVTSWAAPGGSFNWSSPVTGATAAAVVGNGAGWVSAVGGTVTGLNWADSSTLWVRWTERNDVGNDHGLAIDNLSFSVVAAPIPEPGSYAMLLAGLAVVGAAARRRRA